MPPMDVPDQCLEAPPGLERCRYRGPAGTERWVGLGVIAHNLLTIATAAP